jgi:hypothetical protein
MFGYQPMQKKAPWFVNKKPFTKPTKQRRIRARTSERAKEERLYRKEAKAFLAALPDKWCPVVDCYIKDVRSLRMDRQFVNQVHHTRGRIGRLLRMQEFWLGVSGVGHSLINEHPEWARKNGFLCPWGQYNTVPSTYESSN